MSDVGRIACETHGRVPGFIVCVHVMAGADVAHRIEPDLALAGPDHLGEVLCAACVDEGVEAVHMRLICDGCLSMLVVPTP